MVKKALNSIPYIAAGVIFSLGILASIFSPSYIKSAGAVSGPISCPIRPTPSPTPSATPTPVPSPTTITTQISFWKDDVNEDGTNYVPGGTTVFLGTGATVGGGYTGLRFNNVNIPTGANITSAHLEVVPPANAWIQLKFDIYSEASGSSAPFLSVNRPSQRNLTSLKVSHSSDVFWKGGSTVSLNEMKNVIQEVVNRPDWQSGNSLSVILKGTGGAWSRKFVNSYEASASIAPKLVVTYQ